MTIALRAAFFVAACLSLAGCGSEEATQEEDNMGTSESVAESTPKKANNPFAREQQLIRDVKGIQAILDKDAEEKKAAVKNIN